MKQFRITHEHLDLLARANVWWSGIEYGAPGIDPKRPYGNSDVPRDIARILGWELVNTADYGPVLTEEQAEEARVIHEETETALQIILATGTFKAGDYEASEYDRDWRPVPEPPSPPPTKEELTS